MRPTQTPPRRLVRLALAALLLAAPASRAAAFSSDDLVGTWHVLVHYKDSATNNPDAKRWEDRIWVFSKQGSRLHWADYPIVVFDDSSGRFEALGGNRASRVLDYWEPNAEQLAEIRKGLQINPRGSTDKSLHGSDDKGWTSARKGGAGYSSMRFITYEQTWSIDGLPDAPVFKRLDSMGSAATESVEGRTIYTTESVEDGVLKGKFDRDGTRIGTFRMMRSGDTRKVKAIKETKKEAVQNTTAAFYREMGEQLFAAGPPGGRSEKELRAAQASGAFGEDQRRALAEDVKKAFAQEFQRQGNDPHQYTLEIRNLTEKFVKLYVDDGVSLDDIRARLKDGRLRP